MNKRSLLIVLFTLAQFVVIYFATGTSEQREVTINLNLKEDGWYWVQFNLPENGELMVESDFWEYMDYFKFPSLREFRENHGRVIFGTFCCAETISAKYVFLPTDDNWLNVSSLVFFAEDRSIWKIAVPESILTPQNGEVTTTAIILR